ncbi:unnamed protein product [Ectocarpus sp. 13 AM-2016]
MIRLRLVVVALTLTTTAHTCSGFIPAAASAVSRTPRPVFRSPGADSNGRHVGAYSPPTDQTRPPRTLKNGAADSSDDIDLSSAMANARANLAAGISTHLHAHSHSRSLLLVLRSSDVVLKQAQLQMPVLWGRHVINILQNRVGLHKIPHPRNRCKSWSTYMYSMTKRMHTEKMYFREASDETASTPPFSAQPLFLLWRNRALKIGPEGTSPGAGLESAFDQADAAFADLIVTSVDDQGVTLDDEEMQELAQSGMMDQVSTSKKSKGLFGDMKDVFGALSGGAHIVKREDGTL